MLKFLKKKKTVAVFWVISYIILMMITIFGNTFILMRGNSAINSEINLKYSYFLKSMRSNIDVNLKDINTLAYAVRSNESVAGTAKETEINPSFLFELKKTAVEIQKLGAGYKSGISVFVYFPKTDMITFSGSYTDTDDFFENKIKSENFGIEEYRKMLDGAEFFALRDVVSTEFEHEKPIYRFMYPTEDKAVVCVEIEEKTLFGDYFDTEKNDIAVLSRDGSIYISSCNVGEGELGVLKNLKETDITYTKINGKPAGVSYIKSDILNSYKYVFIDRSGNLYDTSKKVTAIGAAVSVISICLMMLILYILYRWNYFNIKDIMNTLSDKENEEDNGENEYEIIKNRQRKIKREANSALRMMKEKFIIDMLTNSFTDFKYVEEGIKKYDIRFSGKYFCVSVLRLKELGVLENMPVENAFYVIRNIMDDILKNESYCGCCHNGLLVYIFGFEKPENAYEYLGGILSESCEVTKMATEMVFTSATSEVGEGISSLPELYESAVSVLNLSEFYGMEEHIFKKDFEKQLPERRPVYSANVENEIISSIKTGDKQRFFDTVDRLFDEYVTSNHEWVFIGLSYSILNSILKIIDVSEKSEEAFDMLNSFKDYNNIEKIKAFIKNYGVYAMDIFDTEKDEKNDLYARAIEYINNNYTDGDMNVSTVSERLGITSIYLAYIVKQNSGIKLSEYIARLRVEKAKELLDAEPELRVEEVAKMSGFLQNRTFYNTFKRYTGLTPTQYRIIKNDNGTY